ncbi:aminotransferase class III-fold pyridoxal phosphate-dependent enzyme [Pendulispora albinea]|uniref:Aminotransferase class III-fold pyridoxal phosphate-dependent enzyme n=1 Tax=Pendulispora albinea TaxID=2741071 RepID=A0ABZ2M7X0_9BACT
MTYEQTLLAIARQNPDLIVMTAENRAAIRNVPKELEGRFIDVGIAEQTMIGAAAGLALRGRRVVAHALSTFLVLRAFEFVRTDIGIAELPLTLVGAVPGFLSEANGPTHQAIEDVAVLRAVPGMQIVCPADEVELVSALPVVIASREPTYLRFCATPAVVNHALPFALGKAEQLSEGHDVTLLTYGFMLREAVRARELLEEAGVRVRLLNMRSLVPVDTRAIVRAAKETELLVVLEDHLITGGLYSIVAETLLAEQLTARVLPIALSRWFRPALLADVLAHEGFDGESIAKRISNELGRPRFRDPLPNRPESHLPNIAQSNELHQRAKGLIPACTQTLAKGPGQYVRGVAPKYLQRGRGARVWDVDGNEYIDLQMAIGPLSLGYCNPAVDDAIRAQLEDGITFSLMHPLEVEVAELVRECVPGAEMVRFSKTGCDVTSAAVRLARAFTGKNKVLSCGYHGWHDWYIAVTDRRRGIPEDVAALTYTFEYNDLGSVERAIDDDTACVILEPVVFEMPKPGFLEELRALCTRRGVLLVFDEMWTGFRLALGGAQEHFGVQADLACFSKAIANGMPLSVLTGRRDVMSLLERDVFFFTTFGGEALSLAAAKATLGEMRARNVLAHLASQGRKLRDGYNAIARELGLGYTRAVGPDPRSMVLFDGERALLMKSFVQQELVRHGILWGGFHNVTYAHQDYEIERVLTGYRMALKALEQAVQDGRLREAILGEPIEPMFRRTSNFDTRPAPRPRTHPPAGAGGAENGAQLR